MSERKDSRSRSLVNVCEETMDSKDREDEHGVVCFSFLTSCMARRCPKFHVVGPQSQLQRISG
jgi:hypothetical protein